VQHDRLELQVMAWGMDDERWLMSHRQIMGDPNSPAVWAALEEQLLRGYSTRNGHVMGIEVAAIDSGGLHTQKVYDFCAVHILTGGRLWWPIKGQGGQGVPIWRRSELSVRTGVKLIIIGVDDAKVGVYSALHVTQTSSTPEGPNYFHLPLRPDDQRVGVGVVDQLEKGMFLDEPAIKRLTAEKLIQVQDERGFSKLEWHKPEGARNEELDCAAYNLAARRSLAVDMGARLERLSRPPEIALDPVAIARKFKR
jgi:phage terminase large subunit GpA-like protein